MAERQISLETLAELVEAGEVRYRDAKHCWIAQHVTGRDDNLLCITAALETSLIVKTIMHHFSWGETS